MNLDELRTVQSKERRKDSLQHLRDSFYEDVADYVADRKSERQEVAATADDPFSSPEVSRLTDEIESAEEVVEAVYERRVGKVVKLASFAAADMPVDEDGMTTQERELFDDLVARIEENKTTVLDILGGDGGATTGDDADADASPGPASAADRSTEPAASAAASDSASAEPASAESDESPDVLSQAMDGDRDLDVEDEADAPATPPDRPDPETVEDGDVSDISDASDVGDVDAGDPGSTPSANGSAAPDASGDDAASVGDAAHDTLDAPNAEDDATSPEDDGTARIGGAERTTVRITRDVGNILGVDEREYDLAEEDVVTLPTANADPLVQRDAAERID